jgi:MSHA pilin protein MshC
VILLPISRQSYQRGFTLIELILVIVLLGVLAVFITPVSLSNSVFYARGFHDETLALLRFAQKSAIAQRRTVCVEFSGVLGATLGIADSAAATTCSIDLQGPYDVNSATVAINARSSVVYSATPSDFNFDGLGQPVDEQGALVPSKTIQVVNASKTITVEMITGYVHD